MKRVGIAFMNFLLFIVVVLCGDSVARGDRLRTRKHTGIQREHTADDPRHSSSDDKLEKMLGVDGPLKPFNKTSDKRSHGKHDADLKRNSTSMSDSTSSHAKPKVHFLFMAIDKISNMNIWMAFFEKADPQEYRVFVHCKVWEPCNAAISGTIMTMVPTVASAYCTDLVSPMNRLLYYAIQEANPGDKFAFISDSTLPAKPFSQVYGTLTARKGSDFCLFPSAEWADKKRNGGLDIAAKYHQWIVLDYDHATKAEEQWRAGHLHGFMSDYNLNRMYYSYRNNSFADERNFGCLDEFWHMLAIYGPFQADSVGTEYWQDLPGFAGGTVYVGRAGWQGVCDTFVMWRKYLWETSSGYNPFLKLYNSLDAASRPHNGNNARPGWWDTMSRQGMKAIRESDFLFVRKFIDNPAVAEGGSFQYAYQYIVLT
eukprot:gnl/TRDRNA2_/TRDRNA2_184389_c0_seq1.p1 gnl/TRDRNA2_/TRDRNA2_184389_c0~~gnl/TRDRNA2_/TRDRNA2_184389_c0_seq1.p1  ORF type:complete len:426 (+),score=54.99 gnl/TRDRNA2_/TRDRNA2_184389_c0_seq1:161-1438(+)